MDKRPRDAETAEIKKARRGKAQKDRVACKALERRVTRLEHMSTTRQMRLATEDFSARTCRYIKSGHH